MAPTTSCSSSSLPPIEGNNNNECVSSNNPEEILQPPDMKQEYKVINNTKVSHDSNLLTIELPPGRKLLGWDENIPTCISITPPKSLNTKAKSYSPISHPNESNHFKLLVKSYPPNNIDGGGGGGGGGVGKYICDLQVGDTFIGKVKSQRIMHNSPEILNRGWKHIGLIAGGTGIAPLYQILTILLNEKEENFVDPDLKIYILSINKKIDDILLKNELDTIANKYPNNVKVTYSLTEEENDDEDETSNNNTTKYEYGRGDVELAKKAIPIFNDPPSSSHDNNNNNNDIMIFVCGKDGFVEHWGGPVKRGPKKLDGSKGPKTQGPLLGILNDLGYKENQVFKY